MVGFCQKLFFLKVNLELNLEDLTRLAYKFMKMHLQNGQRTFNPHNNQIFICWGNLCTISFSESFQIHLS